MFKFVCVTSISYPGFLQVRLLVSSGLTTVSCPCHVLSALYFGFCYSFYLLALQLSPPQHPYLPPCHVLCALYFWFYMNLYFDNCLLLININRGWHLYFGLCVMSSLLHSFTFAFDLPLKNCLLFFRSIVFSDWNMSFGVCVPADPLRALFPQHLSPFIHFCPRPFVAGCPLSSYPLSAGSSSANLVPSL